MTSFRSLMKIDRHSSPRRKPWSEELRGAAFAGHSRSVGRHRHQDRPRLLDEERFLLPHGRAAGAAVASKKQAHERAWSVVGSRPALTWRPTIAARRRRSVGSESPTVQSRGPSWLPLVTCCFCKTTLAKSNDGRPLRYRGGSVMHHVLGHDITRNSINVDEAAYHDHHAATPLPSTKISQAVVLHVLDPA